ncbi:nuclear protein 96-domain-containing protein [Vararia minispora EC-137]|uniref:Nuclear protein 96-domain-containing protein n=1 Tax=Vararia minispora EC-137 TaxID=1314806 RepID=A0ACB8QI74_9AGAM|nr:nuclear protein 96-domain-containing protein [Vararia minispora EC-137]
MARFTALASDSSDEDLGYNDSQSPAKIIPPPPRHVLTLNAAGREQTSDDTPSDAGSSKMDEDELMRSPPPRRRRDRKVLVEGPDGEYYHPHELEHTDESDAESSSRSSSDGVPPHQSRDASLMPWAQQAGVDTQRLHVMQASFFRAPEEAEALRQLDTAGPSGLGIRGLCSWSSSLEHLIHIQQKALFSLDILAADFRPLRKYARVEAASSFVSGAEGAFVDAGLAFGRSFRAGWGPGGSLVYVGRICGPYGDCKTTANTPIVTKSVFPVSHSDEEAEILSGKLLPLHLSRTPIAFDSDGVPFANPSRDLHFAAFTELFPASDHSFEALLFRLGHALFDDFDLCLHSSVDVDVKNRAYAVRRKAALSSWLEDAIAPTVGADPRRDSGIAPAAQIFELLTGHQVEQACDVAVATGNLRLAVLIAETGGDQPFRDFLDHQLELWRDQRVDVHIDADIRRIYGLLAGYLDKVEGSTNPNGEKNPDIPIAQGLDWKRVFGLHLWYASRLDAPIAQVFDAYEQSWKEGENTAIPVPHYHESTSASPLWGSPPNSRVYDALYNFIRLYADPECTLSTICDPLSYTPSPADYTLPWHIYILLSRCMRVRDFADRDELADVMDHDGDYDYPAVEGHSPSADLLASSYAHQLERLGLVQEATFVLLHIESSVGREKAVRDLLLRSAPKLDDWMTRGLAGSLKIPLAWINEAMATHHLNNGSIYEAYQLYLRGGLYNAAHELAVLELAPEVAIRDDIVLLQSLFEKIDGHPVDSWHVRGKAYLDYAAVMTKIPGLRARVQDPDIVPDASEARELDELVRNIPKLLGILPDLLCDRGNPRHCAALSEMTANLTRELDLTRPSLLSSNQLRAVITDESTKLQHLQASIADRFLSSLR